MTRARVLALPLLAVLLGFAMPAPAREPSPPAGASEAAAEGKTSAAAEGKTNAAAEGGKKKKKKPAAKKAPRSSAARPLPPWKPEDPSPMREPETEPLAIVGADIHPVTGPVVPGGILLLRDGRIEAVLPSQGRIPDGYRVIDAHGLQAWPGFVAAGAESLGLAEDAWLGGQEAMLQRGIGESFDPWADGVELAASAGITSALVWRAPAQPKGPLAGRAAVLKMSVREPKGVLVTDLGGALAGPEILTPAGRAALRREIEAARKAGRDSAEDPKALLWRALARGEMPLVAGFDSAADVASVAEIAEELDLRLLLMAPVEAWPLAERLARQGVGVAQNVRFSWGKPREDRRGNVPGGWRHDAIARLRRAGVETAIITASPVISPWGVAGRDLLDLQLEAAFAVRAGLPEQEAIEGITIGAARLLGIDDRVGSLERGKDADVILLDGDPLDYRTFVRKTFVNGRLVHDASRSRFWRGIAQRRDEARATRSDRP